MCIAILNGSSVLPKEYLSNSWDNNSHGAGLLWSENNRLFDLKTTNKKEFINAYFDIRKRIKTPIVLHFRIATSGFTNDNLHPFRVSENLGFVHNGVFWGLGDKNKSDTSYFCDILGKLPSNFLSDEGLRVLVENFVGESGSKLVFLDNLGNWDIIGEELGHWDGSNNWYSNSSYKQVNNYVWAGNKKIGKNVVFEHDKDFYEPTDSFESDFFTPVEKLTTPEKIAFLCEYYECNECNLQRELLADGFSTVESAIDYYYPLYN